MKIIFEADNAAEMIDLIKAFSTADCEIQPEDQEILDRSLHNLRRLARRVEKLDRENPASLSVMSNPQ
jgi:hypothetical protein